jgi:hypothetical protein
MVSQHHADALEVEAEVFVVGGADAARILRLSTISFSSVVSIMA